MLELLDTNIIVRFLVNDNQERYNQAKQLFEEAKKGKRNIFIKSVVVGEVCFVLESVYKKSVDEVASALEVFLAQKWLKVEDRQPLLLMWLWYRKNMYFVDSYLLACAKVQKYKVLSFNKKLNFLSKNG